MALRWRHNGHVGVSNHQPPDCLLNRSFRCRSKKTSKLASLAFVRGIHRVPVNSPHKGPVTRKTFQFDDVIMVFLVQMSHYPSERTSSLTMSPKTSRYSSMRTSPLPERNFSQQWGSCSGRNTFLKYGLTMVASKSRTSREQLSP